MRIGIDVRPLAEGKKTGVVEYLENLLLNILEIDRKNVYILFYNSFKKQDPEILLELEKYPNVFIRRYYYPNKILNFLFWYAHRPFVDRLIDVNILFSPNITFTAVSRKCRHVLTIHDLSFVRYPEFFSPKRRLWHWLVNPRRLAQEAAKIVTVSDFSREEILAAYNCEPEKVERIYPGVSDDFAPCEKNEPRLNKALSRYGITKPYILALATFEPRKNMKSAIQAYESLRRKNGLPHKLIIAGSQGWMFRSTKKMIGKSPFKDDILVVEDMRDEDRRFVYSGADVFIYPSFYEGFGFPPLEALKCGTTVVCSYVSSLPETTGDTVLLVSPHDTEELAWAIERGIKDKRLRGILRQDGYERTKMFSWHKCARDVIAQLTV